MRPLLLLLPLTLLACSESTISVEGRVYDGHEELSGALAGATVTLLGEEEALFDEVVTAEDGTFVATAPEGARLFAEIRGEGVELSSFVGLAGFGDVFEVEERALYGFPTAEREGIEAAFAGCPGQGEDGGLVVGEIRLWELVDPASGESPLITTGRVSVETADGTVFDACYLDDEGVAWDPEAEQTGDSGTFAVFGVPPGVHELVVSYEVLPDAWAFEYYTVRVPEEGGVSPWFPAWVEMAI